MKCNELILFQSHRSESIKTNGSRKAQGLCYKASDPELLIHYFTKSF